MENKEQETFHYTYSAKEQDEVRRIRQKYAAPEENTMERLRRLDAGVTKKATAGSLIAGLVGALLLGLGMSLTMTDLGQQLGSHADEALVIGVVIGVVGLVLIACAYPLYQGILRRERARLAPEILRLTDELMK